MFVYLKDWEIALKSQEKLQDNWETSIIEWLVEVEIDSQNPIVIDWNVVDGDTYRNEMQKKFNILISGSIEEVKKIWKWMKLSNEQKEYVHFHRIFKWDQFAEQRYIREMILTGKSDTYKKLLTEWKKLLTYL